MKIETLAWPEMKPLELALTYTLSGAGAGGPGTFYPEPEQNWSRPVIFQLRIFRQK